MTRLRLLLLSDLHAFSTERDDGAPSYLNARSAARSKADDAFVALRELISQQHLRVDVVACAGDLADRADTHAMAFAWQEIQEIGRLTGASDVVAVCGNHDLDSRFLTNADDPDPKGVLQELQPLFPVNDAQRCDHYWSRNFVTVHPNPQTRIVLLNTSAYHGGKGGEIEHGRVAKRTLQQIKKTLEQEGHRAINILICHHHPFPHARLDSNADYEHLTNGAALLELLDDAAYGPWLILHGHRHIPRIAQAAGQVQPPTVIGAATFSSRRSEAENQFHVLDIESMVPQAQVVRGQVESFTFVRGSGFERISSPKNSLPSVCGFGFSGDVSGLSRQIAAFLDGRSAAYAEWHEVSSAVDSVRFLNPKQFDTLKDMCRTEGLQLTFDENGIPAQIMRKR